MNIVKKNNIDIEKLTEEDLKPFMVGYMKENHHNLLTDEWLKKWKKMKKIRIDILHYSKNSFSL